MESTPPLEDGLDPPLLPAWLLLRRFPFNYNVILLTVQNYFRETRGILTYDCWLSIAGLFRTAIFRVAVNPKGNSEPPEKTSFLSGKSRRASPEISAQCRRQQSGRLSDQEGVATNLECGAHSYRRGGAAIGPRSPYQPIKSDRVQSIYACPRGRPRRYDRAPAQKDPRREARRWSGTVGGWEGHLSRENFSHTTNSLSSLQLVEHETDRLAQLFRCSVVLSVTFVRN